MDLLREWRRKPQDFWMNQLKMSLKQSIISLAAAGWSQRRIARELRIHRETVGKYLHEAGASPCVSGGSPMNSAIRARGVSACALGGD